MFRGGALPLFLFPINQLIYCLKIMDKIVALYFSESETEGPTLSRTLLSKPIKVVLAPDVDVTDL